MARPRTFDPDQVLRQTREAFWTTGYAATGIADLERATGLKRTSLYAAFGDKRSLYLKALEHYQGEGQTLMDTILAAAPSARAGIDNLLEYALAGFVADEHGRGCFINNATTENRGECPRTQAFIVENREAFTRKITDHLRRFEYGEEEARRVANTVFMVYSGLAAVATTGLGEAALREGVAGALGGLL